MDSYSEYMNYLVGASRNVALELGYDYILTLHFLLADIENEKSVMSSFFRAKNIDVNGWKEQLRIGPAIPMTIGRTSPPIPLTIGTEATFKEAAALAAFHGSKTIESHHFFLAAPQADAHYKKFFQGKGLGYHDLQNHLKESQVINKSNFYWNPENELEKSMQLAAHEPAYRPDFFKRLKDAEIVFITDVDPQKKADEGHEVYALGDKSIPIFTSATRVYDNQGMQGVFGLLSVKFSEFCTFFETSFPVIVLNPLSFYSMRFSPDEVKQFVGTGNLLHEYVPSREVFIDYHVVSPDNLGDLSESLKTYGEMRKEIQQISMAWIVFEDQKKPALIAVALRASEDKQQIANEISFIMKGFKDLLPLDQEVIVINLESDGEMAKLMREKPFEVYKALPWWKKLKIN